MSTLLAATMVASQAQVTVNGKISQTLSNTKVGQVTTKALSFDPTDNISFTASETIAGGLKARAVVETSINGNNITGTGETRLGDRQATVGLSNYLGSIDLGRNVHSQFLAVTNNDAFKTGFGSIAGDIANMRGLRVSNGMYINVTPVKGVSVALDRTYTDSNQEATAYSVSGSAFGANLVLARYTQGAESTNTYGANFKVKGTQVFVLRSIDKGTVSMSGNLVGVAQSMGPVTAKLSYGTTNTDTKAYSLGADYAFSKRTEVGVAYRDVKLAGSNDVRQVGVSVTHRF